jgi:hypothetical protein
MLGIQDAYAGLRKAREASQKTGFDCERFWGQPATAQGRACEAGSSTRVPAIRRGPESITGAVFDSAESSGAATRT